MRKNIIFIMIILIGLSCNKKKISEEFYILSYHDSLSHISKPMPPQPLGLKFYSNIVMIFDTSSKIYLYQVDLHDNNSKIIDRGLGQTWCNCDEKYPFFLDLTPNDLITLNSKYFLDFLKENDIFFRLDTNFRWTNRFFYLVSDFDTIKNNGFYELLDHIKTQVNVKGRVYYVVRRTTEEERQVLKYKRTGGFYDPKKIDWSTNFLDGKTKPLTMKYDSLEKRLQLTIKKRDTFKENALKVSPIE